MSCVAYSFGPRPSAPTRCAPAPSAFNRTFSGINTRGVDDRTRFFFGLLFHLNAEAAEIR